MEGLPDIGPFRKRIEEIDSLMTTPDFFRDSRRAAELLREHQKLQQLISYYERLEKLKGDIAEHQSIVADRETDEEFKELAKEELPQLLSEYEDLYQEVLVAMIPPDRADSRNTVMEIRAGGRR